MTDFFGTAQGMMTLGALIGAAGVAIGAAGRSVGHWRWAWLKAGHRKSDARNLAMLTVLALDDFVGACYSAVHDVPEFNPANEFEFAFHVPEPVLTLPKDVDWRLLGGDLGDQIMWMSNRISNFEYAMESLDLDQPFFDGFFEHRLQGYSRLGVSAMDLISRVCQQFDLTMPEKPAYYSQAEGFAKILRKVKNHTKGPPVDVVATSDAPSNVTPLFPKSL